MVIRRNENCEIIFNKYFSKNAPFGAFFFFLNQGIKKASEFLLRQNTNDEIYSYLSRVVQS